MSKAHAVLAVCLFLVLALIAWRLDDKWIRPYGGDVIVMAFLYFGVLAVREVRPWVLGASVFAFAVLIEAAQWLNVISWIGLQHNRMAKIVLGSYADWLDVAAYGIGALLVIFVDISLIRKRR